MLLVLQLFWSFVKIGAFSFGGGYAMIPLIEHEVIGIHRWLTAGEFIDLVAISQMTPGPIAVNAATFVGYRVAGTLGAVAATSGVIAPSATVVIALAMFFRRLGGGAFARAALRGLRPALLAMAVAAAWFVGRSSVADLKSALISAGVLAAVWVADLHPVAAILGAGVMGIILYL